MATYNPFEDLNQLYTYYKPLKIPKTTIENPVFGS